MLILGNGRVVTRNPECPYMEEGAVAIDGKVICKVGPTDELKKAYPDAEFIDAKGGVIMPAFINTHEHIYSSLQEDLLLMDTIQQDCSAFLKECGGHWIET